MSRIFSRISSTLAFALTSNGNGWDRYTVRAIYQAHHCYGCSRSSSKALQKFRPWFVVYRGSLRDWSCQMISLHLSRYFGSYST